MNIKEKITFYKENIHVLKSLKKKRKAEGKTPELSGQIRELKHQLKSVRYDLFEILEDPKVSTGDKMLIKILLKTNLRGLLCLVFFCGYFIFGVITLTTIASYFGLFHVLSLVVFCIVFLPLACVFGLAKLSLQDVGVGKENVRKEYYYGHLYKKKCDKCGWVMSKLRFSCPKCSNIQELT